MTKLAKIALLIISIALYTICVKEYVIMLIVLAFMAVIAAKRSKSSLYSIIVIGTILFGFVSLKWFTASTDTLSLPIGYSVFAFSAISMIIDAKKTPDDSIGRLDAACYLFFFPRMMAGPLLSFQTFSNAISSKRHTHSATMAYKAFKILVYATFCKFVVADTLGRMNFGEYKGFNGIIAIIAFADQLYMDFYAYSNYAIGLAMLVGIKLPISFDSPYKASTFRDFWKRWNITVSQWLRDYIYIPLGGKYSPHAMALIMVTFIISGLWHGFTWPFVIWGIVHGCLVIIEKKVYSHISQNRYSKVLYRVYMLVMIVILWQLFRTADMHGFVSMILGIGNWNSPYSLSNIVTICLCLLATVFVDSKCCKHLIMGDETNKTYIKREVLVVASMILLILLFPYGSNINFFYFRF